MKQIFAFAAALARSGSCIPARISIKAQGFAQHDLTPRTPQSPSRGFQGSSSLPPKSSIAYIRINPDQFAAEYREPPFDGGRVDI
jgi:hypothetical protein